MFKSILATLSISALGFAIAGCSSNNGGVADVTLPGHVGSQVPPATTTYTQIELLSRPAVKEVFETFATHATSNAAEPYADPTIQTNIQAFTDAVRPPNAAKGTDYGKVLASVLYPNVLQVDLSDTTDAATYLGIETGGVTGGKFGGRDPSNDVIDISLGALFGNVLTLVGVPDDGEENNCLSTQNITKPNPTQAATSTFPYLATPH